MKLGGVYKCYIHVCVQVCKLLTDSCGPIIINYNIIVSKYVCYMYVYMQVHTSICMYVCQY